MAQGARACVESGAGTTDRSVRQGKNAAHVDALLIDFDGVLRHWPASDAEIETAHGLPVGTIRETAFAKELLDPAITGVVADEAWRSAVAVRLAERFPESAASEATAQWARSTGVVDKRVLDLLNACSPTLRLVLVTNATTRLPQDLSALGLTGRFHAVANSSELGVAKPQVEFFQHALRLANAAAEHVIYVDDAPGHIAAAARMGIASHPFSGYESMRDFLGEAGVIEAG